MSHAQDMVMTTQAISLEILKREILVFVKQNNFKILNSTCVKVTADINFSQEIPQGRRQEHTKMPKW